MLIDAEHFSPQQSKTNRVVSVSTIDVCVVKNIEIAIKKNQVFDNVCHTMCTNQTGVKKKGNSDTLWHLTRVLSTMIRK